MSLKKYLSNKKLHIVLAGLTLLPFTKEHLAGRLEKFVKNFPEKVPYTDSVKKFYVPGSKHVIIHIRQVHYAKGIKSPLLDIVDNVQKDIYNLLSLFINRYGIKTVRVEGSIISDNQNTVKIEYDRIKNITHKEYVGGGAEKLVAEGKLIPKPTEELFSYLLAAKCSGEISLEKSPECTKLVIDNREDIVMKFISGGGEEKAFVSYGGDHAFGGKESGGRDYDIKNRVSNKDNIAEWNKNNPNDKFSLVEITPKSYADYRKLNDYEK